jgi:hypothetical protein
MKKVHQIDYLHRPGPGRGQPAFLKFRGREVIRLETLSCLNPILSHQSAVACAQGHWTV